MRLKWKCLSGLAPLKPVIGLRPVWGWPVALTCHSSCLTRSHKTMHVKTGESCFTLQRFSRRGAIPHWLLRLAVMTGKHVLIAGSGSDKSRHVGASDNVSTICFTGTLVGTSWGPRGDPPFICCDLIQSDTTNLHPLHLPKTFNPYLSCYEPYLDANRKPFSPPWLFKDAGRL